ncbi:RBP11-like subunits of RNA polymerase, partial [Gonapodya prolifera JEL478]
DSSCVTISLNEEDHTVGNTVRYMVMKNPVVEYCGYSIPHPSETKVNIRIQTLPSTKANAVQVFEKALDDITDLCDHVLQSVESEVALHASR